MLKLGGVTAAGALGASMLAACATAEPTEMADTSRSEGPGSFLIPPEPIVDFAETKEYDVVVVGAGEAGLSAVHTALEAGAKVACVQNMESAKTTGNFYDVLQLIRVHDDHPFMIVPWRDHDTIMARFQWECVG